MGVRSQWKRASFFKEVVVYSCVRVFTVRAFTEEKGLIFQRSCRVFVCSHVRVFTNKILKPRAEHTTVVCSCVHRSCVPRGKGPHFSKKLSCVHTTVVCSALGFRILLV